MSKTQTTKLLIADSFKRLADKGSLDKISVGKIMEAAGLNRQTFYYHFQDKQELICWIFDTDLAKLVDKRQDGSLLDDVIEHLYDEKSFYRAALALDGQNSLRDHLFTLFQKRLREEVLVLTKDQPLDEAAVREISLFFAHGLTGSIVQWSQTGMDYKKVACAQANAPCLKILLVFTVRYVKVKGDQKSSSKTPVSKNLLSPVPVSRN